MQTPKLVIVVPCYNEEEVLPETIVRLTNVMNELMEKQKISRDSFILFVDDGSRDRTWEIIENTAKINSTIRGLKLTRNFGHQNALIAGMEYVVDKCDCLITIDADLQQDENAIGDFLDKYSSGAEIVLGIRKDRKKDGFFKKMTALGFYELMKIFGVRILKNHADYRLLSNRVNKELLKFAEVNLFLRGLITYLGFKTEVVYFDVKERFAGKSKYSFKKMLAFAWDGITSFSVVPLRFITLTGFLIFLATIFMSFYVLYVVFFTDRAVPGWASTVLPMYFLGGVQLLSLGIIGEYIGKIYKETKRRPRYLIEKEL
ncbi:glycosyltransferase family 2 protein [Thermodesulfovibrio sp. Kuro-1]|uniref:glycosyltransferase family 2 protein n=2 Tax=Thermodesulfovibrio TaxID=28261 RepID=UPI001144D204|nr:glycosyltransferase family 2 protein [Thermodesulfovibrio sp. Kuro-1]